MQLRPYQIDLKARINEAWSRGDRNVLAVLPTGGGKTVVFSDILKENAGPSVAIAHRRELVAQMSMALARSGVIHRVVAPVAAVKLIVTQHTAELGRSYFNPAAPVAVAGVRTLASRAEQLASWARTVILWVQDEGHHVLQGNEWGAAVDMFPQARGLGVTATPLRADGNGLGRHADGVFDTITEGPGMRDLIRAGYLCDYRIYAPPSDIDLTGVTIGSTGDYSRPKLKRAVQRSRIVGDVVEHYLRLVPGRQGVTFCTDVETAGTIAQAFNAAGVRARVVTAKTPEAERAASLRMFRNREIQQLVNVDLFGEGFDVPGIEVVSMARPTQSYGLYCQQFGRALRILPGKSEAVIIDHVGNVVRHGLPDRPRVWTLDRREKRRSTEATSEIPLRVCTGCTQPYERIYPACPWCGCVPVPESRSGPEFVDGDLAELDADTLAAMRGEVAAVDRHPEEYRAQLQARRVPDIGVRGHVNRHVARQEAQAALRSSMAWWAGYQRAAGRPDSESYRRFYFRYGIDVLSAQALGAVDALELAGRINSDIGDMA